MSQEQKEAVKQLGQITTKMMTQENLNKPNKKIFDEKSFERRCLFYKNRFESSNIIEINSTGKFVITDYLAKLSMGMANKGILFEGFTGRGKTFYLDVIRRFHGIPKTHYFKANEIASFCKECKSNEEYETRRLMHQCSFADSPEEIRDICIDDIGTEPMLNIYGVKVEALELCIDELEEINKERKIAGDHKIYLFATTNLNEDKMEERYGSRFVSRINALCNRVAIIGKDLRTL